MSAPVALASPARHGLFERRAISILVIALGLVPSLITAWILWLAPIDALTADRTAFAARDYTAFWAAGRLAAAHTVDILADPARYTAYLRDLFGSGIPDQIWPYPPPMLLLAQLFAAMPLGPGFVVYIALTLLALAAVLRFNGISIGLVAAVVLSPAVAVSLLAGQNGVLIAALLVGGLLTIDRNPFIAGLLLGALCIKPQFGLLLPFCLLAGRRKRTALGGCASVLALAFLSLECFGHKPWVDFLVRNRSTVKEYVGASWQALPSQSMFSSVFMAARSVGAQITTAYMLQALAVCGCCFAAWRLWSDRTVSTERRCAATIALALLAAPWVHTYDMPALAVAIVLLLRNDRPSNQALLGFAWLWPGLSSLAFISPMTSMLAVFSVAIVALMQPRAMRAVPLPA